MGIDVKLRPELEKRVRVRVLYDVVHELLKDYGASEGVLDTVRKGILDRQLLEEVTLRYWDDRSELICEVEIRVDWERHQVAASSSGGKHFLIDSESPLLAQISEALVVLGEHLKRFREHYGVQKITGLYVYRKEVRRNDEELAEARQYLGTSPTESPPPVLTKGQKRALEIEVRPDKLKELGVKVRHSS